MIELNQQDRVSVVRWLSELPQFEAESGRRQLISLAGLGALAPQIDVSGAPFIAASAVVDFLVKYGRPTPDTEALGLLLNVVASLVGTERQAEISSVLERYAMMTPIASVSTSWPTVDGLADAEVAEKIIGQNTLRPISFLMRGLRAAAAVALIEVAEGAHRWSGTGFLVGPDLLLTNHHVIGSDEQARGATATFDYELDEQARMRATTRVAVGDLLASSESADCALVRLDGRPGDTHGWLKLRESPIAVGDRVNIVQHPGGQPKQIALQNNLVEYIDNDVLQYVTSTLPGSSGAPVFDDAWHVVAIHHAGGMLIEPASGATYYRNEGIRVRAIRAALPDGVLPESDGDGP
jgi:V8-like Glu-specific endopeptidase